MKVMNLKIRIEAETYEELAAAYTAICDVKHTVEVTTVSEQVELDSPVDPEDYVGSTIENIERGTEAPEYWVTKKHVENVIAAIVNSNPASDWRERVIEGLEEYKEHCPYKLGEYK